MAVIDELRALAPTIEWGQSDYDGRVCAVIDDMEIVDPFVSECGRFTVDPQANYGIPRAAVALMVRHNSRIEPRP